ncbi:MAG: hypothetical protein QXL18_05275 [Candidatus Woesearchaeota archaeon]
MRKNLFYVTIIITTLFFIGIAYAAYKEGEHTWGETVTVTFTPSNNVYIDYANGTNGISYVAGSYHIKGSRTFGTSSGDTKIYYKEQTGASIPAAPATNTATANFSGWTAL